MVLAPLPHGACAPRLRWRRRRLTPLAPHACVLLARDACSSELPRCLSLVPQIASLPHMEVALMGSSAAAAPSLALPAQGGSSDGEDGGGPAGDGGGEAAGARPGALSVLLMLDSGACGADIMLHARAMRELDLQRLSRSAPVRACAQALHGTVEQPGRRPAETCRRARWVVTRDCCFCCVCAMSRRAAAGRRRTLCGAWAAPAAITRASRSRWWTWTGWSWRASGSRR